MSTISAYTTTRNNIMINDAIGNQGVFPQVNIRHCISYINTDECTNLVDQYYSLCVSLRIID